MPTRHYELASAKLPRLLPRFPVRRHERFHNSNAHRSQSGGSHRRVSCAIVLPYFCGIRLRQWRQSSPRRRRHSSALAAGVIASGLTERSKCNTFSPTTLPTTLQAKNAQAHLDASDALPVILQGHSLRRVRRSTAEPAALPCH